MTKPKKRCIRCKKLRESSKKGYGTYELTSGNLYIDKTCRVCRVKMRLVNQSLGRNKQSGMYLCIHDPIGVYYNGHFDKSEVLKTLRDGYWTPGMIFLDQKTGTKYRVEGNDVYYHMHRDLRNVPIYTVKKESQKLVVI